MAPEKALLDKCGIMVGLRRGSRRQLLDCTKSRRGQAVEQACAQKVLPEGGGADLTFGQWSRHLWLAEDIGCERRSSGAATSTERIEEAAKGKSSGQKSRRQAKAQSYRHCSRDGEAAWLSAALEPTAHRHMSRPPIAGNTRTCLALPCRCALARASSAMLGLPAKRSQSTAEANHLIVMYTHPFSCYTVDTRAGERKTKQEPPTPNPSLITIAR